MAERTVAKTEKSELLKVEALRDWLKGQVASGKGGEEYIWQDPVYCLMGRFLADHGRTWGEFAYSEMPGYDEIAQVQPWTLGAALGRAEHLIESRAQPVLAPPHEEAHQEPVVQEIIPPRVAIEAPREGA